MCRLSRDAGDPCPGVSGHSSSLAQSHRKPQDSSLLGFLGEQLRHNQTHALLEGRTLSNDLHMWMTAH